MLIRPRGGNAGVFRYLRDGIKSGRKYTRDQLDERVVLAGDMGLAESVVNAMSNRGEKYLHITLSFKEDHLALDTLRSITEEFEQFCMTAFRVDEYAFYAEAHLPRIKSYTDKRTGKEVIRKPHIHIVIPELNLLCNKNLNPFGKVSHQTKFIDAWQEHINSKYGLESPKDNRRVQFTDESTLLSRQKGDYFDGIGSDLKRKILDAMLERGVESFGGFEQLVAEFGATRLRNEGKPNAYINVRPEGAPKGVNLKDFVFSPGFIEMPTAEKKAYLAAEAQRRAAEAAEYVSPKSPRPSPAEITDRLAEWHEIRARELKYMNSGSKVRYAAYKKEDAAGKKEILDEREAEFYKKHGQDADADLQDVLLDDLALGQAGDPVAVGEPEALPSREPESVIEQLLVEHKKEVVEAALATSQEHTEIKLTLDATQLLARLSHTHGVITEKYPVTKGADGGDRIQCGSRRLNVSDFLTKELHLPWTEAQTILREAYAAQQASVPAQPRAEIRSHFWQSYREMWPARKADKEKDRAAQKAAEASRRAKIKEEYLRDRAGIKADLDKSPAERKAAYSIASMRKALESAKLYERIAMERQALREKHPQSGRAGYKFYLVVLAHDCNASALAELRRQTPPGKSPAKGDGFSSQRELDPATPVILPSVSYRVDQRGNVTYFADVRQTLPILLDTGREVQVLDHELESVEVGLRLALVKFGRSINVHGSRQFKLQVLDVVVKKGLHVEFKDPVVMALLGRLKQLHKPVTEPAHITLKNEEEIEAESAYEVHGQDVDLNVQWSAEDLAENENEFDDDNEPAPGGPRMG
jgi:hypothetical protein